MRRYAVITAVTAAVAIVGGVALESMQQNPPAPTPSPIPSASQIKSSLETQCEQASEQIRKQYPDVYDAGCNSGSSTLTIP